MIAAVAASIVAYAGYNFTQFHAAIGADNYLGSRSGRLFQRVAKSADAFHQAESRYQIRAGGFLYLGMLRSRFIVFIGLAVLAAFITCVGFVNFVFFVVLVDFVKRFTSGLVGGVLGVGRRHRCLRSRYIGLTAAACGK